MTAIVIRDDIPATSISPELWGVFFEDLNYSADGGLYAELIQNRSFAYSQADHSGWGPMTGWRRTGRVEIHHDDPLGASPNFARLFAEGETATITNDGFDGIRVVAGARYLLSVFARAPRPSHLRITLATDAGAQSVALTIDSPEWKRFDASFHAASTSSNAHLQLSVRDSDAVDLGYVSLFPSNTFRRADNGLRADLGQAIADLEPRFVRFPGGCLAHGLGLDNLYRWKDTIGQTHERTQNFNLWGYHQSMGLGFFEYFQFCEQLGATPLPVLAAGVCCQNLVGGPDPIPLDQMDDYIADIVDLIEFANGPVDSPWGRRRAELGHPHPFGLTYLAIGNEDQIDATFRSRFHQIFDAIRSRHPEITIVGTVGPSPSGADFDNGWAFARELHVPVVDEHMYKAPKWFFENTDRYDAYDRSGPAVYVGEYGTKGNRLLNAIAEAAFMIGMERNGDIVRFASYAPLLAKNGHTQWMPDLIYFDNEQVMPSLNYYVQQMFAANAGDRVEPVDVFDAPRFVRPPQPFAGIQLQTEGLDVRFAGIRLNDLALPDVKLTAGQHLELAARTAEGDYTIRLQATATAGDPEGSFAIHFGAVGTGDNFTWNFGSWKNNSLTAFYTADGDQDELLEPQPFSVVLGRTYSVEIVVRDRGTAIDFLLDGNLVQRRESTAACEQRFLTSSIVDARSGRRFLRVVNATDEVVPLDVAFASGVPLKMGAATSLFGDPHAGAAFTSAPYRPIPLDTSDGSVSLPAFSFTIVEIVN